MSLRNPLPRSSKASLTSGMDHSTVRIAVMGATGSGKTTLINLASGSDLPVRTGLESCTAEVKHADEFSLDGRAVTLIDTPGFNDTSRTVTEVFQRIAAFLAVTYEQGSQLSGVIYIHRISDNQFGGISGRTYNLFRTLCGDAAMRNVVLVTNMWGEVSPDVGEAREKDLSSDFLKPALDEGAQMVRHDNTIQSAHGIVRIIIRNAERHNPVALRIQHELVDRQKNIVDTIAGKAISQELTGQIKQHRKQLREVLEAMVEALKEQDEETMEELEGDQDKLQERMKKIKKDLEGMSPNYASEKGRMEAKMKEVNQGKRGREQDEMKRSPDPTSTPATISPNDPARHDALYTSETSEPLNPHKPPPPSPSPTPSALIPTYATSSSARLDDSSFLPTSERNGANDDLSDPPNRVRILVMGAAGSGKTTFINLASGSDLRVGTGSESCTADVKLANEFILDGNAVTLIDTPGFDDTTKNDTDILKIIAAFLATTYEEGSRLSGVIYIHRIDSQFAGIAARNFDMLRKLCGDAAMRNVVLVTNMWDEVSPDTGKAREYELYNNFFKHAMLRGTRMFQHHNIVASAHEIVRMIIPNPPVVLQIQWELVIEKKDTLNTAAGDVINKELKEQIRRYEAELEEVRAVAKQALGEEDEELMQELQEETRILEELVEGIKKDSEGPAAEYAVEKEKMKARVKEMEQEAEVREMEQARAREMKRQARTRELEQGRLDNRSNNISVRIPIYYSSDRNRTGYTRDYPSTVKVSASKKDLMTDAIPQNRRARFGQRIPGSKTEPQPEYKYLEVIMHGETEGRFLQDRYAKVPHDKSTIGQVLKLCCWTRADIDREVDGIVSTLRIDARKAGIPSSEQAKCYWRLHVVRGIRDRLRNDSNRDTSHAGRVAPVRQGSR